MFTPDALLRMVSSDRRDIVASRLDRYAPQLLARMHTLYGAHPLWGEACQDLMEMMGHHVRQRSDAIFALDLEREAQPDWFLDASMIGYSAYADRFGGTLQGVSARLDYLQELGVRYLHLLPIFEPQPEASDGGFAVADHLSVARSLGNNQDLVALTTAMRARNMSLCLDFVLNHTAQAHAWATAARDGSERYRGYYHIFEDRVLPDQFEDHLDEVFPVTAPGNFTRVGDLGWVWTTFYPFQWDLNWSNPRVFVDMVGVMLGLANLGVEALRIDSAAFVWKRPGTDCRNQPEAHDILAALRAISQIVTPGLLLKAEAIVPSRYLAAYFGEAAAPECHLAYHSTLMSALWMGLSTGRADQLTDIVQRIPSPPRGAAWATYLRCHDDINWPALAPEVDQAATTLQRAADFYAGGPGSFARGASFQSQAEGAHGTNGMLASLAGLEVATTPASVDLAHRRIRMLISVLLATGGLPILYMGDELGMLNDWRAAADRLDGRWLHRPTFDDALAATRHDLSTTSGRIWGMVRHIAHRRASTPAFCGTVPTEFLTVEDPGLLAIRRPHPDAPILVLASLTDQCVAIPPDLVPHPTSDLLTGQRFDASTLDAYAVVWLKEAP